MGVNKATKELFKVADTPQKMLALGEARVRDYIKTIGLYRNKAKNVIALSQKLIDDFDGVVPEDRDALGISDGVVRLSLGLEDVDDLIADIDQALSRL